MRNFQLLVLLLVLVSACTPTASPLPGKPSPPVLTAVLTAPPGVVPTTPAAALSPSVTPPAPTRSPAPSATVSPTVIPSPTPAGPFPIRAAFYYPWFPQAWRQSGLNPFTHFHPALGYYSSSDPQVIKKHIAAMQYGKIQVGIASWWGPRHHTDTRIPALLKAGEEAGFAWALYVESEGQGDPSPEKILADLTYIRDQYAGSPAYQKIGDRFLVFVYADGKDKCGMATRWKQANTVGAYVVLKVFDGFQTCPDQPDGWHQYGPASPRQPQSLYSYTISPGFWKAGETKPRLARDLEQWQSSIRSMMSSKADFHLITTFNEWGEGTAVEDALEWTSPSGYGYYLDALHYDGSLPPALLPDPQAKTTPAALAQNESGQTAALLGQNHEATFFLNLKSRK